ncbi:MAG: polysaccharide deacetylase family protein [Chitinophagaceae bacterium]
MNKILLVAVMLFLCASCKKYNREGSVSRPGIVLTFDDYSVKDWYDYLPMLDSFGVKATFYISNYNRLNAQQKTKLHAIENAGHEIGFHTLNHPDLTRYIQKWGMQTLVEKEIEEGLKLMNEDGFHPTSFAYPYGSRLPELDIALWKYFKSLRALNGTKDYAKSCTGSTYNPILYGLVIDEKANKSTELIDRLITGTKENGNCLVLCAHQINSHSPAAYTTSDGRLRHILTLAKQLGLKFYTAAEVAPK